MESIWIQVWVFNYNSYILDFVELLYNFILLSVMTAVTFPLRPPRLAFAICGWRWQNDVHEIKYSVCVC